MAGAWPGQLGEVVAQASRPRQAADNWVRGWPVYQDAPPEARKVLEVKTVFQKICKKCPWEIIATLDPNAYQGAAADMEFQMKYSHPDH